MMIWWQQEPDKKMIYVYHKGEKNCVSPLANLLRILSAMVTNDSDSDSKTHIYIYI